MALILSIILLLDPVDRHVYPIQKACKSWKLDLWNRWLSN